MRSRHNAAAQGIFQQMISAELGDLKSELQKFHAQIQRYIEKCMAEGSTQVSSIVEQWLDVIEILDNCTFEEIEDLKDVLSTLIVEFKRLLECLPTKSQLCRFVERVRDLMTKTLIEPSPTGNPWHPGSPVCRGLLYFSALSLGLMEYQIGSRAREAVIAHDAQYTNDPAAQGFGGITKWSQVTESTNSGAAFYRYARDEFNREFSKRWEAIESKNMADSEREEAAWTLAQEIKRGFLQAETPAEFYDLPARYGNPDRWVENGGKNPPGNNLAFFDTTEAPAHYRTRTIRPTNFLHLFLELTPALPERTKEN